MGIDSDGHLTLIRVIDLFLAAKAAEGISPKTAWPRPEAKGRRGLRDRRHMEVSTCHPRPRPLAATDRRAGRHGCRRTSSGNRPFSDGCKWRLLSVVPRSFAAVSVCGCRSFLRRWPVSARRHSRSRWQMQAGSDRAVRFCCRRLRSRLGSTTCGPRAMVPSSSTSGYPNRHRPGAMPRRKRRCAIFSAGGGRPYQPMPAMRLRRISARSARRFSKRRRRLSRP